MVDVNPKALGLCARWSEEAEMVAKYGRGTFSVDWEERYDFPTLRRKRVEKAQDELSRSRVDALLLEWMRCFCGRTRTSGT